MGNPDTNQNNQPNLFKSHPVPVFNFRPIAPDFSYRRYYKIRKDGSRVLTKEAKDEIKKRLENYNPN